MLNEIFQVRKPIIGMVHVGDLYSPKGLDYVTEKALGDAYNLHLGGNGVDGLLVENWEEKSDNPFVTDETIERMLQVTKAVRNEIKAPVGVNVLHNDYKAAFRIARQLGLQFIQLDVYVDRVRTEFEHTQGVQFDVYVDISDVNTHRRGTDTALFVNIHPKHYTLLENGKTIEESAKQAIDNNSDGVVVTRLTGTAPDIEVVRKVKEYAEGYRQGFPVIVGSGVNSDNFQQLLQYGDGAIVGTTFKIEGLTDNPVDSRRVEQFMEAVHEAFR
ncbi:MAG: BtpA/SgcQ family protein [Candidatus Woesearchaeota archaeon]